MTNEEREKIQKEINDLQAVLDEDVQAKNKNAEPGDVYDYYGCPMLICKNRASYDNFDKAIDLGGNRLGYVNYHKGLYEDQGTFIGKFENVFISEEQLKKNFETMKEGDGYLPSGCIDEACDYIVDSYHIENFIDNLFNNKNCDGSNKS